jgi:FKBP-type peptidyl-prolyl cis-trans isomerase SlyD
MRVEKDKVVSIDYTLTDAKGKVIDSSKGKAPLPYIHGAGNIIKGLESALEGKQVGDELKVTVPPEQGYGVRDEKLVAVVPRDSFKGIKRVERGMQFQASQGGQTRTVTVVGFQGDDVKVDANHPLAGQALNFEVKVVEIRDAQAEELAHGHVHGPGGHHHH